MKYELLFAVFLPLVMIAGCQLWDVKEGIKEALPGTYIRFSQHEYGTEYDTLVIVLHNASANEYTILRKWKYERVRDGQPIEPEYKRTATSAIYNPSQYILQERETGDSYSLDIHRKILFNGSIKYNKL